MLKLMSEAMSEQAVMRRTLETRFRRAFTYNVSELAAEQLQTEGLSGAAERCRTLHEPINSLLWLEFTFGWAELTPNPGGTRGRAQNFLLAKLELTVTWAGAGADAAETQTARENVLECLHVLWPQWAGYMVTTPEFEAAL